jgi:DNA-binding FrmR family transcriptional regulator
MADSWMDKLKSAAGKVADGAKDLASSTRLKMDISGLQGKVKEAKGEFGVNVYAMIEQGRTFEDITVAFTSVQSAVKDLESQVVMKQEELKKIGDDNA